MDSDTHVCPACGQPVDTVVRRHKTLGAWVPVWVPGPCRNPKCEAYVDRAAEQAAEADEKHRHRATTTKTPATNIPATDATATDATATDTPATDTSTTKKT
jgi:hypothetical protein